MCIFWLIGGFEQWKTAAHVYGSAISSLFLLLATEIDCIPKYQMHFVQLHQPTIIKISTFYLFSWHTCECVSMVSHFVCLHTCMARPIPTTIPAQKWLPTIINNVLALEFVYKQYQLNEQQKKQQPTIQQSFKYERVNMRNTRAAQEIDWI